jgi:2-amino-4-hydroxy-6-hydroxymethyldihydropteridine diphosphokinase
MSLIILLLGSNSPDKANKIREARQHIASLLAPVQAESALFETEPWGFRSDEPFLNQALITEADYTPEEIMERCLKIELQLGRIRNEYQYESRTIDIDLLFYDSLILKSRYLTIPHPRLHHRRFVLEPLNEIAPDFIHPVLRKSISELLADCKDTCWVRKLKSTP